MRVKGCIFSFLTAISIAVPFGIIFWFIAGRYLHINVYSDGEFWYREDFTDSAKLVVTLVLSGLVGLVATSVIKIVRYYSAKSQ